MDRSVPNSFVYAGGSGAQSAESSQMGQNEASQMVGGGDAQALQFAGYPALMQQYFQQQQVQQQQQQQQQVQQQMGAAGMDPRFAGFSGFAGQAGMGGASAGMGMGMNMNMGMMNMGNPMMSATGGLGLAGGYGDNNRMMMVPGWGAQGFHPMMGGAGAGVAGAAQPVGDADPYAETGLLGPWSATSAGLLGKMASNATTEAKGKRFRKKPKDRPKRPLSAYNLFFKAERARILEKIPASEEGEDKEGTEKDKEEGGGEDEVDGKESPTGAGKGSLKSKKRPHGKIGFESLAKVIGQRWQELSPDQVELYKKQAEVDMKRYKQEMEVYLGRRDKDGDKDQEAKNEDGSDEPFAKKAKSEEVVEATAAAPETS